MTLVFWRNGHSNKIIFVDEFKYLEQRENVPMNGALDVSAGQKLKSVAGVDSYRRVQGFDPLPFVIGVVPNLKASDGLAEEEGEAS